MSEQLLKAILRLFALVAKEDEVTDQERDQIRIFLEGHVSYATVDSYLRMFDGFVGNLARKKLVPPSLGTFPVTTPLFTVLLVSVIVVVGALTFFPALSLGPIVEHFLMHAGTTF